MSRKPLLEIQRVSHEAQLITVYWFGRFDQATAMGVPGPVVTQPEFRAAAEGRGWSEFGAIYDNLVAAKIKGES